MQLINLWQYIMYVQDLQHKRYDDESNSRECINLSSTILVTVFVWVDWGDDDGADDVKLTRLLT